MEPFIELLKQAGELRRNGERKAIEYKLTNWLSRYFLADLEKLGYGLEVEGKNVAEVAASWAKQSEKEWEALKGDFYAKNILLSEQIAKKLRIYEIADYRLFVGELLKQKNSSKIDSQSDSTVLAAAILSLHIVASHLEEIYLADEIAKPLAERYRGGIKAKPKYFIRQLVGEWSANSYQEHLRSASWRRIESFRGLSEKALTPILLSYFAFWIRKLGVPEAIWKEFCIPEVLRDACGFFMNQAHQTVRRPDEFFKQVAETSQLVVKGFVRLVEGKNPRFTHLEIVNGKVKEVEEGDATYRENILQQEGGLTTFALFSLMRDGAKARVDQESDADSALIIFLNGLGETKKTEQVFEKLFEEQFLRQLPLEQYQRESLKRTLRSTGIGRDIEYDATILDSVVSLSHCQNIQRRVSFWIYRDFAGRLAELKQLGSFGLISMEFLDTLCESPIEEWMKKGGSLRDFLRKKTLSGCRKWYRKSQAARKREGSLSLADTQDDEDGAEEFPHGIEEGQLTQTASEKAKQTLWLNPRTVGRIKQRDFIRLYLVCRQVIHNAGLTKRSKQMFMAYLRVTQWSRGKDDDSVSGILAGWFETTPRSIRATVSQTKKKVGPLLKAALSSEL